MVTDGSYICGEYSIMFQVVKSCCTPESDVVLCVDYTSIKKKLKIKYHLQTSDVQYCILEAWELPLHPNDK